MSKLDFTKPISVDYPSAEQIDSILESFIPKGDNRIIQAIKYSLLGGGKRIRFRLVLAFGQFFNSLDDDCVRLATAVEMIHTYSLIHDDLPSMDNDDYRRGKPSCHKAFDESTALLAGNGLLTLAASILADRKNTRIGYSQGGRFVLDCAGVEGMLLGQVFDMEHKLDSKVIALYKTAKLFIAGIIAAGLYADVPDDKIMLLNEYAENFGTAFQLADDLADNQFHGWAHDVNVAKTLLFEYSQKCTKALYGLGYTQGYAQEVLKYFDV